MKLSEIAKELIDIVDGTKFKVEFTSDYVTLWLHGVYPLISFNFYRRHAKEELSHTLNNAKIAIDALKKDNK